MHDDACVNPGMFQQPDVTRMTSSKADMHESTRASDPPNYHAASAGIHLLPGTSHHAGGGLVQQFSPSSDSIFRPINQAYMIQATPHQQAAGSYLGSRDRNLSSKQSTSSHCVVMCFFFLDLHGVPKKLDQQLVSVCMLLHYLRNLKSSNSLQITKDVTKIAYYFWQKRNVSGYKAEWKMIL